MAELIVALDLPTPQEAREALARLRPAMRWCKIGLELFSAAGPDCVREAVEEGWQVFLDLKLHDIPRTVERAVQAAAGLRVRMLTIHASGGRAMIGAAVKAAHACGAERPAIVAVTALTSLGQADLTELNVASPLERHVESLAMLAYECGADGVVCSPREVARLRTLLPDALLVTPGVRPSGAALGDQKRVATPAEAVRAGATHLVVGRPILEATDPGAAAAAILQEMAT